MEESTPRLESARIQLSDLERVRILETRAVQRLEALLGKARVRGRNARRGGFVAQNLARRQEIKIELAAHANRLRTVNAAIKAGRRSGAAMLLTGLNAPKDERELVATLYRMFVDVVAPDEQDERQRAVLNIARDYVMTGRDVLGES